MGIAILLIAFGVGIVLYFLFRLLFPKDILENFQNKKEKLEDEVKQKSRLWILAMQICATIIGLDMLFLLLTCFETSFMKFIGIAIVITLLTIIIITLLINMNPKMTIVDKKLFIKMIIYTAGTIIGTIILLFGTCVGLNSVFTIN